jgi:hypothetical protein
MTIVGGRTALVAEVAIHDYQDRGSTHTIAPASHLDSNILNITSTIVLILHSL